MKLTHLLFVLAVFSFTACGDDDGITGDPNELSYDGTNASSPELESGTHILALRFPASDLDNRIGKKLHEVEVFVDTGADYYKVNIYGEGTSSTPGSLDFSKDFTNQVDGNKWEIVSIDPPIEITGKDIWIGVEVGHSSSLQTIGCDSGPRKDGGDWIWNDKDQTWQTFQAQTGTESVNWNIKGHLID